MLLVHVQNLGLCVSNESTHIASDTERRRMQDLMKRTKRAITAPRYD